MGNEEKKVTVIGIVVSVFPVLLFVVVAVDFAFRVRSCPFDFRHIVIILDVLQKICC